MLGWMERATAALGARVAVVALVVATALAVTPVAPGTALADDTPGGGDASVATSAQAPAGVDVRAVVLAAAAQWGVDGQQLLTIAQCESSMNPAATGPDGAAGLFQIAPRTWAHATDVLLIKDASPYDPVVNANVAAWLLATGGPRQWGCS